MQNMQILKPQHPQPWLQGSWADLLVDVADGLLALAVHVQDLQERLVDAFVGGEPGLQSGDTDPVSNTPHDLPSLYVPGRCPTQLGGPRLSTASGSGPEHRAVRSVQGFIGLAGCPP